MKSYETFKIILFGLIYDYKKIKQETTSRLWKVDVEMFRNKGISDTDLQDISAYIDTAMQTLLLTQHIQYVPSLSNSQEISLYDMTPTVKEYDNRIETTSYFFSEGKENSRLSIRYKTK